jgi:uncharacterized membrane protein (UPF0127 family)
MRFAAGTTVLALLLAFVPAHADGSRATRDAPPAGGPFMPLHEPLERYEQADVVIESGTRQHTFRAWLANTPERREQGLMWVRSLPADRGMLFVFEQPQPVSFWMKNTYVSLDLMFVAPDGRIIRVAENAEPLSPRNIDSMGVVLGVFEVRGGTAKRLGIQAGDRLRHPAFARR